MKLEKILKGFTKMQKQLGQFVSDSLDEEERLDEVITKATSEQYTVVGYRKKAETVRDNIDKLLGDTL